MTTMVHRLWQQASRFLVPRRLHAEVSPGEAFRIERVICVARLLLAVVALIALDLDPLEPAAYAPTTRALLVLFAGHSFAAVLVLRRRPRRAKAFALTTHVVDLLAASLTLPMAASNNPFFAFFLFVLASASFRWGLRETIATTAAAIALMLLQPVIVSFVPVFAVQGADGPSRLIARTVYLVMMGLVLGYLAEESRLLRAETGAVVRLLGKIRVDVNVTRVLTTVGNEALKIFGGSHLLLVVEELGTQRVFRWDTVGGWSLAVDRSAYFFGSADHNMAIVRRRWLWSPRASYEALALDSVGRFADTTRLVLPEAFVTAHPFRRLILAPITFGDEWSGRIFIFEPKLNSQLIELSTFLKTLIRQVGPAVFSVYLQNRIQARAGALERARVARELHDGVIQSLIGVEMQLDVLRRQKALRDTPEGHELQRLQSLVRDEVLNLRDLMQQMRPAEFDPDELLDHLADMVQRFGREVGVRARFVTELKRVALERRVCFELVRIVQEGLANIRKHSAARNVVVRFGVENRAWWLEIEDDGRGFPFEGQLSLVELEAKGEGPAVIKERVRAIGGQLTVESTPGRGSRLIVLVPQEEL